MAGSTPVGTGNAVDGGVHSDATTHATGVVPAAPQALSTRPDGRRVPRVVLDTPGYEMPTTIPQPPRPADAPKVSQGGVSYDVPFAGGGAEYADGSELERTSSFNTTSQQGVDYTIPFAEDGASAGESPEQPGPPWRVDPGSESPRGGSRSKLAKRPGLRLSRDGHGLQVRASHQEP